ncbi:Rieske 2Fe-2S domain-containing protein [Streptomyces niveus]|uniref:Rieske 2Fe-2S domain-containing protein n=1 Tax=Streptomyces niveus TaxID=193462 RepID=UPI0036A8DF3D
MPRCSTRWSHLVRRPVVTSPDEQGEPHCLINACSHRGAILCRRTTDHRTLDVDRLRVSPTRLHVRPVGRSDTAVRFTDHEQR